MQYVQCPRILVRIFPNLTEKRHRRVANMQTLWFTKWRRLRRFVWLPHWPDTYIIGLMNNYIRMLDFVIRCLAMCTKLYRLYVRANYVQCTIDIVV